MTVVIQCHRSCVENICVLDSRFNSVLCTPLSVWLGNLIALSVLALPFSNAAVQRTFSQMNLIKSKLRSRMHQELQESMLYVRGFVSINGLCSNSFQPTADMFTRLLQLMLLLLYVNWKVIFLVDLMVYRLCCLSVVVIALLSLWL